jgi:hypothetical protein
MAAETNADGEKGGKTQELAFSNDSVLIRARTGYHFESETRRGDEQYDIGYLSHARSDIFISSQSGWHRISGRGSGTVHFDIHIRILRAYTTI